MKKANKIITVVIVVALIAVGSYWVYVTFLSPKTPLATNYEVNTSFSLDNGTSRNLVNFNITNGGSLWVNYTSNSSVTLYVLNATQMSAFSPGSPITPYYSPGANLTNFSSATPINLVPGYYYVIFYNGGTSTVMVTSANVTWDPF